MSTASAILSMKRSALLLLIDSVGRDLVLLLLVGGWACVCDWSVRLVAAGGGYATVGLVSGFSGVGRHKPLACRPVEV